MDTRKRKAPEVSREEALGEGPASTGKAGLSLGVPWATVPTTLESPMLPVACVALLRWCPEALDEPYPLECTKLN